MGSVVRSADGKRKPGSNGRGVDGVYLRRLSDYALTLANTDYDIPWDSEQQDDADYWSSGDNTKLYAPRAGWYIVFGTLWSTATSSSGVWYIKIKVNGTVVAGQRITGYANYAWGPAVTKAVYLSASDYVTIVANASPTGRTVVGATGGMMYVGDYVPAGSLEYGTDGTTKRFADGVSLSWTGTLTLAVSGTLYSVPWATENIDQGDYWSSGDNTKIYAPRTGWYYVSGQVSFENNADTFTAAIYWNGTSYQYSATQNEGWVQRHGSGAASTRVLPIGALMYLNQGEYIQIQAATRTASDNATDAEMSMVYLGDNVSQQSAVRGQDGTRKSFADGVSLRLSGTLNLTTGGTYYYPTYDAEDVDQSDYWSAGAGDTIYMPRAGWAIACVCAAFSNPASGASTIRMEGTAHPDDGAGGSTAGDVPTTRWGCGAAGHVPYLSLTSVFPCLGAGLTLKPGFNNRDNTQTCDGIRIAVVSLGD